MKFGRAVMPLRMASTYAFSHSKMDIQTSEVDAKFAAVNMVP
jgi:hypothetical protein